MKADDFLDDENWHGSYYELAVLLGSPDDSEADTRAHKALRAAWSDPHLEGCYLDRWHAREDQVAVDAEELSVDLSCAVYGRAWLPNGLAVVCVTHVIREEGENATDWLDVCLPTGALERAIPQLGYPLHKDGSRVWREPIDSWLVGVAERIAASTPFHAALIGEETSGHPSVDGSGAPLPGVQARTSILTCTATGVRWHRPLSW